MWVENARRPRTLPVAVSLKRFLAPGWVFVFGMGTAASKADVSERQAAAPREESDPAAPSLSDGSADSPVPFGPLSASVVGSPVALVRASEPRQSQPSTWRTSLA